MNDRELAEKVHTSMDRQCRRQGYAAPVDVLMDLGVLKKEQYENWRHGRVPYLERVCTVNLSRLSAILREMKVYAGKAGLKPSFCFYRQWAVRKGGRGKSPSVPLRFSRSGKEAVERQYATHFVDAARTAQLKELASRPKEKAD